MMNTTISAGVFIATAILVVLLVAARIAVQGYGHRIGADDVDFNRLPDPEHKRSRYANLRRIFTIASVLIGLWIIFLGARMTLGAWFDYGDARQMGTQLGPSQLAGALGMAVVLVGIGLIVIPSTLRWDYRPDRILTPRPAFRIPIGRRQRASETDFSTLMEASGDSERPRAVAHWYNANPIALVGMLVATIAVFLCYLVLFILIIPMR